MLPVSTLVLNMAGGKRCWKENGQINGALHLSWHEVGNRHSRNTVGKKNAQVVPRVPCIFHGTKWATGTVEILLEKKCPSGA